MTAAKRPRLSEEQRRYASVSERDWQQQVRDAAVLHGWKVHCVYDSRRSPEGWPDLFMVRVDWNSPEKGRLLAAELKSERGKVTTQQEEWLSWLEESGVEVYVWRPHDIDRILEVLA